MVDARGIIGNYLVERELGRGGMGVVYAAKHRVLGRPAAIKLLLANTSDDRGRVERFFNEARAAMAIDHPGVVKIYDVGIAADDRPYIAMELLDGTALASLIAPAGLPIRQGVEYACQIASALTAAHDAGVIHRDLKPENIIITRDRSRAIVVDFGIAKLSQQATVRTATGALVGTPLYMSPEQCEGLRELDARSDLYAFGCVIFAMLTGRPPFFEGGTGGLIGMHLHVAPPLLRSRCANASEALERVVSVLLAKSPDARFRTARAALAALQAPEVRGLAAAPGVPATADVVQGNRSVQPWAATPAVPPAIARDAQTAATGVGAHASGAMGSIAPHAMGASAPGIGAQGSMAPPGTGIGAQGSMAPGTGIGAQGSMAPPGTGIGAQGSMAPGTAFGVPASRDAWTQVTGADFRDPRTAAVQAVGTPSPSSSAVGQPIHAGAPHAGAPHAGAPHASASQTPHAGAPHAQSRRKLIVAIVASSALTAIIAIVASRGCGGSGGSIDAGVASGSGSAGNSVAGNGSGIAGDGVGAGSNLGAGGSNGAGSSNGPGSGTIANARVDAGVADAAVIATNDPRGNEPRTNDRSHDPKNSGKQPKNTPQPKPKTGTTPTTGTQTGGTVQIDPNGPPLGQRPRNDVPGAGAANNPTTEDPGKWEPKQEVVRKEIHDAMSFQRGDWAATLGSRALDRVAATHRLDPTRRIVITAYAENDEPGVLATLAENRGKTAYKELLARGVSKSVLVMNSTLMIEGSRDGSNRRVTFDFE